MRVEDLAAQMTEREFASWQRYAARKMLPQRRLELYLARIAMLIAQTMVGHADAELADYLFDPRDAPGAAADAEPDDDELVQEARDFFGFAPAGGG